MLRAEFEILQGLKQTLLKHRPIALVEILKINQDKTLDFLKKLGYRIEPFLLLKIFIIIQIMKEI